LIKQKKNKKFGNRIGTTNFSFEHTLSLYQNKIKPHQYNNTPQLALKIKIEWQGCIKEGDLGGGYRPGLQVERSHNKQPIFCQQFVVVLKL
jgi:hypothetical protein